MLPGIAKVCKLCAKNVKDSTFLDSVTNLGSAGKGIGGGGGEGGGAAIFNTRYPTAYISEKIQHNGYMPMT